MGSLSGRQLQQLLGEPAVSQAAYWHRAQALAPAAAVGCVGLGVCHRQATCRPCNPLATPPPAASLADAWCLPECLLTGSPCGCMRCAVLRSASLFDFGLFFFHNARESVARGYGPYFYLPKMESHLEARLWNDTFNLAQGEHLECQLGAMAG